MATEASVTNAEKYGSLSTDTGIVDIAWSLCSGADCEPRFTISWIESGGPPLTAPSRNGFGTLLIKRNMEHIFGCRVTLEFASSGLKWIADCDGEACLTEKIELVDHGSI